jgi:hypothetical protein
LFVSILCVTQSCAHRNNQVQTPQAALPSDNSYMDLAAGGRIRVMVPLLKSGESKVVIGSQQQQNGNTIVLSAGNLVGYQMSYYFVEGRSQGRVRLRFIGAQTTRDGKTEALTTEPRLPFVLPAKAEHIRLIYYIRNSESDHNMAIASSRDMEALGAFTKRLEHDPSVCGSRGEVFCSWVPAGVALRPE